ncbi:hypothetical protein KI688_006516 [Linnemannia hyalina]|uniref:Uncharacterized protein n=1 Tax=Linnemannia hyalina TaxID=64524 RepID=A0A9P8BMX8_9FUNG|nr:hypothetical protein KI688_006516 [Linnemannia hyalina]
MPGTVDIYVSSVLYFDGNPAKEKEGAHQQREKVRQDASKKAEEEVDEFAGRVDAGLRIRKQHYINIYKNLSKGFKWKDSDKDSMIKYLTQENCNVVLSATDAGVKIAEDFQKGYIVVSVDSDLAVHPRISLVWRPISQGRFLEYRLNKVLAALGGFSRKHLTVLGIVPHNDYNKNIHGLGCATNFGLVKGLPEGEISMMVENYLADPRVALKNKAAINFGTSIKVFGSGKQTALPRSEPDADALSVDKLKAKFNVVKDRLAQKTKADSEARLSAMSASTGARVYRHKASQQFNRYRVIDQLPPREKQARRDKNRIATGATSSQQTTASTSFRPRFSLKSHIRAHHEPPRAMKQYTLKPWKSKTEDPDNTPTMPISDNTRSPRCHYEDPVCQLLMLNWSKPLPEHLFATLEIGTVATSVRSALKFKDATKDPVIAARITRWLMRRSIRRLIEPSGDGSNYSAPLSTKSGLMAPLNPMMMLYNGYPFFDFAIVQKTYGSARRNNQPDNRLFIPVRIHGDQHLTLIDTGATHSFISARIVSQYAIPVNKMTGCIELADSSTIQRVGETENVEVVCGSNLLCAPYEVIDQQHALTVGMDLFRRYGFNVIGLPDPVKSPDRLPMPVEDEKPTLMPLTIPEIQRTCVRVSTLYDCQVTVTHRSWIKSRHDH